MQRKNPSRTQEQTRQRIRQAAGEVFAELGYETATVRDICTRAGVNVAAVNYHFGDKRGLYMELMKLAAASEAGLSEGNLKNMSAEEALHRFVRSMLLQMTESQGQACYVRVMAHELVKPTEALAAVVEHVVRPRAKVLYAIVGRLIGRPALDPKTRRCAHSVIAQIVHYVHARPVIALLWPEAKFDRKAVETQAHHISEFSLAAMQVIRSKSRDGAPRKRGRSQ